MCAPLVCLFVQCTVEVAVVSILGKRKELNTFRQENEITELGVRVCVSKVMVSLVAAVRPSLVRSMGITTLGIWFSSNTSL